MSKALIDALQILADLPFEDFGHDNKPDDYPIYGYNGVQITIGHVRAARAAILSTTQKKDNTMVTYHFESLEEFAAYLDTQAEIERNDAQVCTKVVAKIKRECAATFESVANIVRNMEIKSLQSTPPAP